METVHIIVSGIVQGVGFRFFVRERAMELGVTGYARNLPAGNVEIVAQAKSAALDKFIHVVRQGPRHAEVHAADVQRVADAPLFSGFTIG